MKQIKRYVPVVEASDEEVVTLVSAAALAQHARRVATGAVRESTGRVHEVDELHLDDSLCARKL